VYLLAVSDIAIEEILAELQLGGKTLVHTAASVPKDILAGTADHFGVFYPLQSMKKSSGHLPDIPVVIDASDADTLQLLETLAHSISDKVVEGDDAYRVKLHLAAVFCNNFTNHIYTLMDDFCRKEGIDFQLLIPLIKETALRLDEMPPAAAQTGPALRKDAATIATHLNLLESHADLRPIYELLTASIQQRG
jgi:predicted short-subunit dehydrogenase-like oxidoreductase (DUF2520 family)